MSDINQALPRDWHGWAHHFGWVHYGYKAGKPLLMKIPSWARPWSIGL